MEKAWNKAQLLFNGQVVFSLEGLWAKAQLLAQADRWNASGYEPDLASGQCRCLADLPTEKARIEQLLRWGEVRGPGKNGEKPKFL